jgi:hypothetical protein
MRILFTSIGAPRGNLNLFTGGTYNRMLATIFQSGRITLGHSCRAGADLADFTEGTDVSSISSEISCFQLVEYETSR